MRVRVVPVLALFVTLATSTVALAQQSTADRWESVVAAYEATDHTAPPPKGEIVFVGSSSIQRWDTAASFPDLKILNRGISGSEMSDALKYVDRLIIPYEPRLVVVYAGDNDIAYGKTSEQVEADFERFVSRIHTKLPRTRIVVIGLKPSLLRWTQVDRMRLTNSFLRAYSERDDLVAFVDVDNAMLGWDEKPRPELFVGDGLHMTAEGYRIWTSLVRPLLTSSPVTATATR